MTTFLFVRHGEPDYSATDKWDGVPLGRDFSKLSSEGIKQIEKACDLLASYNVDLIVSSPFTRALQGAAIMAKRLQKDVVVETDLHEWQVDTTYTVRTGEKITSLCRDRDRNKGIYPKGRKPKWESDEIVRNRVINCLKKYSDYDCVVICGHAIMMMAVLGIEPPQYGQVVEYRM